jgi:hypothetical protein
MSTRILKLQDMAVAALDVLNAKSDRWWLMVERAMSIGPTMPTTSTTRSGLCIAERIIPQAITKFVEEHKDVG